MRDIALVLLGGLVMIGITTLRCGDYPLATLAAISGALLFFFVVR